MASGSVWGIDIGKSSLKAVRMHRGKEELEIQALFYEELSPAEDGTIPPSEASRAIEALCAKHPEVKKERAFVALAGHQVFARFIKLPAFDPKKVDEMVRYEATQAIPFPIPDVNWDYAMVDREYEAGEEREVGIFAVKKDLAYAFLADLQLSGIEPYGISTGPLSIYNFVRWDMEIPADAATVVLDIGWDHTDLVIIDGDRFWIRNLNLNGRELTKAIATKLKVPFTEAESQKRGAAESQDSRKIYQATELVLKDYVAEIQRSIAFYKTQNKDRQIGIGQVLLLGNGSKLPNIRPYFQKELGIPVETVKHLTGLALDTGVEGEEMDLLREHLPSFAVAFGLGIQGCESAVASVNLLPEEIRQRQALEAKKPIAAAAVAIIWLTVILSYLGAEKSLERIKDVSKEASKNLTWLKQNDGQRAEAKGPIAGLEKDVKALAAMSLGRNVPVEILNKLAACLPKNGADVTALTDAEKKDMQGGAKQLAKVQAVVRAVSDRQGKINDGKTWLVDLTIRPGDQGGYRCSLLVARKYAINAQGLEDEAATKLALEQGILADLKREFPKAAFEGAPRKIWNLDKEAQAPGGFGTPGGGASVPSFCGLTIVFDHGGRTAEAAPAAPAGAGASGAEEPK